MEREARQRYGSGKRQTIGGTDREDEHGRGASGYVYPARSVLDKQNDWASARQDFLHAYSLDPASGFSLNNRGYVAEMDGDIETAQFYYGKARKAGNSNARIGLATQTFSRGREALNSRHR